MSAKPYVHTYKFNELREFLTEDSPTTIFNILDSYRAEANEDLILKSDEEKKKIVIEDKSKGLVLTLKFYQLPDEDGESTRLKMRFLKKAGSIQDQYELINELTAYLAEVIIDDEEEEE